MAILEDLNVISGHSAHTVATLNKDKSSQSNLLTELWDWESTEKGPGLSTGPRRIIAIFM